MKAIKNWGVGDIVKNETSLPIDGTADYSHIEALSGNDIDNHISIRRSVRNLLENEENLKEYFEKLIDEVFDGGSKVFSDSLTHSFELENSDFIYEEYNGVTKAFVRLKPGIAHVNGQIAINRPSLFIAERELEKVFNLDTWHPVPEGVKLYYSYENDLYQAEIRKREAGSIVTYTFDKGAGIGNLVNGYENSVELFKAISDNVNLGTTFKNKVQDLNSIQLEPVFELPIDTSVNKYIGYNENAELVFQDTLPYFKLFEFIVDTVAQSDPYIVDQREFFVNLFVKPEDLGTAALKDFGLASNELPTNEQLLNNNNVWESIQEFSKPVIGSVFLNKKTVTDDLIIPDGYAGSVVGDIELEDGVTLEIGNDSTFLVLPENIPHGSAAYADLTTSNTDDTTGRVLKVGDFGVGEVENAILIDNFDDITIANGTYRWNSSTLGTGPTEVDDEGVLQVFRRTADNFYQIAFTGASTTFYIREYNSEFLSWQEVNHSGNTGTSVKLDATTSLATMTDDQLVRVKELNDSKTQMLDDDNTWSGTQDFTNKTPIISDVYLNRQIIDTETVIPTGYNGLLVGDVELEAGGTLEVEAGGALYVLPNEDTESDTSWNSISVFENSWTYKGSENENYYLRKNDWVFVNLKLDGSSASGDVVFTLPSNNRPKHNVSFILMNDTSAILGEIKTNGNIEIASTEPEATGSISFPIV